jgi:lambda family phage portal protein
MPRPAAGSLVEAFENIRSDYNAARENRFRRRRKGWLITGSNADFHYRLATDYLRMVEYARCMDRDDVILGCAVDRAVTNTIHTGITLDPSTGDPKLDEDQRARWKEWADDAGQCDLAQEHTFRDMEGLVLRAMFVDGDHFVLPTRDGSLQLIEGHLCRTPRNAMRNKNKVVIHGVMLGAHREREQFWFCKEDIDPWIVVYNVADMVQVDTRDEDGERQVFQIYNPKRVSQTRGVSAIAPMIDTLGYAEDINFCKYVQHQSVSCWAVIRNRELGYQGPLDSTQQTFTPGAPGQPIPNSGPRLMEGLRPGMQIEGLPGEKIEGFSPNVPNPEFFEHIKWMMTLIGINLGLPLVMLLMDGSETNYSGWRGAIDQSRLGFRRNQRALIRQFHTPVYRWKVRQWLTQDPILARMAKRHGIDVFGHKWNPPGFPYVDPQKDAAAELLRERNGMTSHRRLCHDRGEEWTELVTEIIEDNFFGIRQAIQKARILNKDAEDPTEKVHWRELLPQATPDGINLKLQGQGDFGMADTAAGASPAGPAGGKPNGNGGGSQGKGQKGGGNGGGR